MSLQDGQVDDDDRHDTEDYVRPGNAGDICRSGILSSVMLLAAGMQPESAAKAKWS